MARPRLKIHSDVSTNMQLTAVTTGTMDKAVWAYYEGRFHPAEKVHEPWVEHNDGQVMGGLGHLDACAAKAGDNWLAGTGRISQADISASVAITFANRVRPHLNVMAAQCPFSVPRHRASPRFPSSRRIARAAAGT